MIVGHNVIWAQCHVLVSYGHNVIWLYQYGIIFNGWIQIAIKAYNFEEEQLLFKSKFNKAVSMASVVHKVNRHYNKKVL